MTAGFVHLRAGGVSLLLDARGPDLPCVLHWGEDLGPEVDAVEVARAAAPAVAQSALEHAVSLSLLPETARGHRGRPGLIVVRDGRQVLPRLRLVAVEQDGLRVGVSLVDGTAGITVEVELALADDGLLTVRQSLRNDGGTPCGVESLATVLPLPERATELLDLTGRWLRERHPQRHPFVCGSFARETRHGRTGHDATLLLVAGTARFTHRTGEAWAVHLGWSGDAVSWAERGPALQPVLGAAELLAPGEVVLGPGERHVAPCVYAAWSGSGLDGVRAAFHGYVRARPEHPRSPRPVVLNTWEAVYFDHDLDTLLALADRAAEVGVERFVLDDGWFSGRRDDTRGLGDWMVDREIWPDGLTPLIRHVADLGMQFGLWVEPEMVSPDSDLARAHPDWVLSGPGRAAPLWRHQQVLDLTCPEAFAYVLDGLDTLLAGHAIGFLKWDHNRDLVDVVGVDGRPVVRAQTLAAYALLDELRRRHPGVEIESCSSGGARVDLGILERTDRVWASDTNDALERQTIQGWTGLLLPPELVGAHVGPPRAHTTGRTAGLAFRLATALFGSFGVEWDLVGADAGELAGLAEGIAAYRRLRPLLHAGTAVNGDVPDDSARLHGIVATDGSAAVFAYVQLTTSTQEVPAAVLLPGLTPECLYRVVPLRLAGGPGVVARHDPPWWTSGELRLSGRLLGSVGLRLPVLFPEQALLLELHSLPAADARPATA